jgi:acetylornithine/succinyldiaminopimelate/putrescine aminotransferase/predicted amino acid dehydrogenase
MDLGKKFSEYLRPQVGRLLELLKLDVHYHRAEGDIVFYRDSKGEEKSAVDFLGGFGSTLLGHNPPEIAEALTEFVSEKGAIHTQASVRGEAALLAEDLDRTLKKAFPESRGWVTTLASTGTEAVEAALKHALMEFQNRKRQQLANLRWMALRAPPQAQPVLENLIQRIEKAFPQVLAFSGGFHGKTTGSVLVTSNEGYRSMYGGKVFETHYLSRDISADELVNLIRRHDVFFEVPDLIQIHFSSLIGLIYEPIQGEGGLREISPALLTAAAEELRARRVPLICDEIQSGLYRTGRFLASEFSGVQPDYVLLGKSFGGSYAKISACVIAKERYLEDFGWLHTSTFSEDGLSSRIARKTLQVMEADGNRIAERAAFFESKVREFASRMQAKYPGILREARGRGFFMGLDFGFEFQDSTSHPSMWQVFQENGHAASVLASYLLHHHGLRVGAALSAPGTLRLEPSWKISNASMDRLFAGLEEAISLLHRRQVLKLVHHVFNCDFSPAQLETVSELRTKPLLRTDLPQVAFFTHILHPQHLSTMDQALKDIPLSELERFAESYSRQSHGFRYHQQIVRGANGREIQLNLYGLFLQSSFFENSLRARDWLSFQRVQEAMDLAASDGMDYVGLGQYTSIVSGNGLLLETHGVPITTGNSLTAGMAYEGVRRAVEQRGLDWKDLNIGVVGFTGNVCHVLTQVLADHGSKLTLVYREPYETSLKFQKSVERLLKATNLSRERMVFSHSVTDLVHCDVVVIGTNSSRQFIRSEHVKKGAVILDISVPSNLHEDLKTRDDVSLFYGGLMRLPFEQKIEHIWYPMRNGDCYACLAETLAMGLLGRQDSYSTGQLEKPKVLEAIALAKEAGIEFSHPRTVDFTV